MPAVTFLPEQIKIEIPANASLLEAARLAGVFVETPCGGKGTCAKCLVKVVSGAVDPGNATARNLPEGHVMICQAHVLNEPVCIELLKAKQDEEGQFEHNANIYHSLPETLSPLVQTKTFCVSEPVFLDGLSDLDRFQSTIKESLVCNDVVIPLSVLTKLPVQLRENDGTVTILYYLDHQIPHLVDAFGTSADTASPDVEENTYGIAVDIGTTTIALWLIHMKTGQILASKTAYNAQIECGLDVISRINYAKKYLPDLQGRVAGTINQLIHVVCVKNNIQPCRIVQASFAGNPTMVHLLLGIMPEYLRLSPYTPAVYHVPLYPASQIGINIHPNTPVYMAPSVGSYVGGDITAGALCTTLATDSEETVLFLDIGTNGEILLGNKEFILGCACSAGPAFEGGGIEFGMRASNGAIEKVEIDGTTGSVNYKTIGNEPPVGICGSGVISLIAELFKAGWIDAAGKFTQNAKNGKFHICETITLSEADIDNLIRAKGAIFSACQTLLKSIGLSFQDLDRIYIAGGFGSYLNLEDAQNIGLLPGVSADKVCFLGNTSLIGAYLTLLSKQHRIKEQEIADNITYIDLSNEPGYMDEYMASLFIPHTDHTLFGNT